MAMQGLHICGGRAFKPGDPPPEGYHEWQEWAHVQYRAGLRQTMCSRCRTYQFPQQLARETPEAVCKGCAAAD